MKKIILVATFLISAFSYAQQEIKLDVADAIGIRSLEFSYETYINDVSSFGVSALFNLTKQDAKFRYNENIMMTPYFRHYFTSEAQWNFFGEGFLGVNTGKKESIADSGTYDLKYTDAALGVAIGSKYIAEGGLTIDAYLGLGRNLFGSNSPILVPRLGLNVGWRF
ncbi:MAG: DUF3575 domain-containing protein [Polaribacter sp.]|uniref:DUF3575 domain-containing protein n=1 Tax=Polaribacter sp. TaxID=1920175 RepID=UPI0026380085|nr:DUF3575 domain-containing protein [uncultured Polaribacter sp.]